MNQELLKEYLNYDPDTGVFTWIKMPRRGLNKKSIAGTISAYGYRIITLRGELNPAHRLAFLYMTGCFPNDQVDHINRIKTDNRWCNLRQVSNKENCMNKGLSKANTTGVVGVYWHKALNNWQARIRVDNKLLHIGHFNCITAASIARKAAELNHNFHANHGKALRG